MARFFEFFPLLLAQQAGSQRLERIPEPSQQTDAAENVLQYDQVMTTKLVIAYAAGLEIVHRARTDPSGGSAIDLACGPGHYTLCLARYLDYDRVTGIDLSPRMVETARGNAARSHLEQQVRFQVGDVRKLDSIDTDQIDLASFTDAAHHMPDLETVSHVFREMDRITRPEGLVMVMDLVRLRTARLTERYVNLLGHDYRERGLPHFFDDFRNSMYAAWTANELRRAIPKETGRTWCQIVPRGLPTVQVVLGLPAGRTRPFVRPGFGLREHPLIREWYPRWVSEVGKKWADETLAELKMQRLTLRLGSRRR